MAIRFQETTVGGKSYKRWLINFRMGGKRHYKSMPPETPRTEVEMTEIKMRSVASLEMKGLSLAKLIKSASKGDWGRLYSNAMLRAKQKGLVFTLSRKEFAKLIQRSDGRCELTGLPIDWERIEAGQRRPFAPSLDRIDRSEGYTADNCRIVCVAMNIAVNEWDIAVFSALALGYVKRTFGDKMGTELQGLDVQSEKVFNGNGLSPTL